MAHEKTCIGIEHQCADVLKAVHRGEGTIDLGRLCILDNKNYAAISYFLDRLQASDIPYHGIREFLSEDEFAALFELQKA